MTTFRAESKPDVWVGSEWGKLREVIVGRVDQLTFPSMTPVFKNSLQVFAEDERQNYIDFAGMTYAEAIPERFAKMQQEADNWVALLEGHGIKVHRPRLLNEDELEYQAYIQSGVTSFFVKDPLSVVGNVVIEGSNRVAWRRKDVFTYRELLEDRIVGSNAKWVTLPTPMPDRTAPNGGAGPFLTGGDVFPMGNKRLLLGFNDVDSDIKGIRWVANVLEQEGWEIHFVPYTTELMHLDCAFSAPKEGVALVCPDAFPEGLPDLIKDWDLVECSIEEARVDACNGLPLGDGVYAMGAEFEHLGKQLERYGVEPHYVDMAEINHVTGGGMRCSHCALVRDDIEM